MAAQWGTVLAFQKADYLVDEMVGDLVAIWAVMTDVRQVAWTVEMWDIKEMVVLLVAKMAGQEVQWVDSMESMKALMMEYYTVDQLVELQAHEQVVQLAYLLVEMTVAQMDMKLAVLMA